MIIIFVRLPPRYAAFIISTRVVTKSQEILDWNILVMSEYRFPDAVSATLSYFELSQSIAHVTMI